MNAQLESISFVGDALAPFFLNDPATGSAGQSFAAFAELDVAAAAQEWPFGDAGAVREGLALMKEGLSAGVNDDVTWEYRHLFVGPGHKAAAPWGSVYTDHDGVIFGESALDLAAWMRAQGIDRLSRDGDPEDHIGLLLAMMAWLARNRPELLDEFLGEHVLTWSSHFLELMQRAAHHPFYKGLALLTRASLEGIQSVRNIPVEYPRYFR